METLGTTIALFQAISSTIKAIKHIRGLPAAFKKVQDKLPLTENTLCLARDQLKDRKLDSASISVIEPIVSNCHAKANELHEIFKEIEGKKAKADWPAISGFYYDYVLGLGKTHRVEALMKDILGNIQELALNQFFRLSTHNEAKQLEDAIEQLSDVDSSVPDSFFRTAGPSGIMNVGSGGTVEMSNPTIYDERQFSVQNTYYGTRVGIQPISIFPSNTLTTSFL